MVLTHEIANYPGVENISGYQLSNIMKKQAKNFGCVIKSNIVITDLQIEGKVKQVTLDNGVSYTSDAIIFTPGRRSRTLNIKGKDRLKECGISYCATCDGEFFTDIKNLNTGEVTNFKTEGVFVFIGYLPNTEFLKDKIALNASNEIIVNNDMATNIEGVYAAGDSTAKCYRQVTTAVADGTIAALATTNYIHQLKSKKKLTLTQ